MRKTGRIAQLFVSAGLIAAATAGIGGAARAEVATANGLNNAPGYSHLKSTASQKCIDPVTESVLPYVVLEQQNCRNAKSQEWKFVEHGHTDGKPYGYLVNNNSRLCASIADDSGLNGTPVLQVPCDRVAEQEWELWPDANPQTLIDHLVNLRFGMCLDLENGSSSNGVPMQVWTCDWDTYNQLWEFA